MQPEFEDEEAIDPFDFWQGANFKLKAKNVAGYRNYDSSEFAATSALLDDDDAMEAIWKKEHSLAELVANDQFKTYDELKTRLSSVLGTKPVRNDVETVEQEVEDVRASAPVVETVESVSKAPATDEDDDALSYFAKLAES
jgi:hypothetical protein